MKNGFSLILRLCAVLSMASCSNHKAITGDELAAGFVSTPDSIQTSVYWYWISNHISADGVKRDLESMKEIGIDRAFIGNIGLEDNESGEGAVKFYSDEWWNVMHSALKTATELGIDIGIFNCPGWSQSGGPWVKPQQSMRYLAQTSVDVQGGRLVSMDLQRPQSEWSDDFQDVRVLAFPAKHGQLLDSGNTRIVSTPMVAHPEYLIDGNMETSVELQHIASRSKDIRLYLTADKPFTLRSLKLYVTDAPVDCPACVEAKIGDRYQTIAEFPVTRFNPALHVGFDPYAPIVITTPTTTATQFRLTFTDATPGFGLREMELSSQPVVERYPEKTLAKMFQTPLPYWHEYMWRAQPEPDDSSLVIDKDDILDISDCLKGDHLEWNAPQGKWTIMRTGMLPTGVVNSPARPEAEGLETDKMSKKHIRAHFEAFLGEIYRRIPVQDRKCWKVVVEDSYETGGQNFTDGFIEDFKIRYGYDPVPFLPVYAGEVVQSEDISDRFLWDMRRLVADKVAYDYVAGLREISHKYGLTTWLENYGHWGFPGEFLQYGGQSDEIGGEFWSEGSLGDIENRAASSCGHIYGKTKISAESFTAGGGGFHRYPAMMKQRGDRFFTEGINNTLLHLYISQPYEEREPGVNATFGNEFNRKNVWFPHLDMFIKYIKRVNFMLQQGLNIADVAYFIGEDTPKMTGIANPPLPKGYQFDYINAEVIERDMTVVDGLLTLPHGTQYRMLVLPELQTMRPELLRKIKRLIEQGAVVLGPAPHRSPSYENYPVADREVNDMATELWSQIDGNTGIARIGRGMLMDGLTMEQALSHIDCVPDCRTEDNAPILYCHRTVNNMDIYFVSNQSDKPISVAPEFRIRGMQPEAWNAIDGSMRVLPAFKPTRNGVEVPLKLDGYGSLFIVFRRPAADSVTTDIKSGEECNFPPYKTVKTLDKDWTIIFDADKRGPAQPVVATELFDLSTHGDFNIRHYSGPVIYRNDFEFDALPDERIYLNLNDVVAMAKVRINGICVGGVWTPPYRVDITDAVKAGRNEIEIEVVTTWKNRIIGDLNMPESQRRTWVAYQPWTAHDELQKTGLIGPVVIETNKF